MSHHPTSTKEAVVNNYYNTANAVSSGPVEREHSINMVDKLLEKNGYNQPRLMYKPRKQQSKKAQCKRIHIFIAQFAIFRVFQEVNGS